MEGQGTRRKIKYYVKLSEERLGTMMNVLRDLK